MTDPSRPGNPNTPDRRKWAESRGSIYAMRMGCNVTVLAALAIGTTAACHDDFPDRLKKGCNSAKDCNRLVAEAADRLNDCAGYLVGNRLKYNWPRAKTMCHREIVDCNVAFEKANQWVRWANANSVGGGPFSYYRPRWR